MWWSLALLPAFTFGYIFYLLARLTLWVVRGGSRVVIPWSRQSMPRYSVFACRRRTREGSLLRSCNPTNCSLFFWKRRSWNGHFGHRKKAEALWDDLLTFFTGVKTVAVHWSHQTNGEPWVMTSGRFCRGKTMGHGPHYAPLSSFAGAAIARVNVSAYIDGAQLLEDLRLRISDPAIRATGVDVISFVFGLTRPDRVTCSGLIGRSILRQTSSPLAGALRHALHERVTYGEITPADLARAAAILGLVPEGEVDQIYTRPIWMPKAKLNTQALNGRLE